MDRSRREGRQARRVARPERLRAPTRDGGSGARPTPPAASRLTLRRTRNRRRAGSVWSRLPRPAAIADACGRALRRSLSTAAVVAALLALGGAVWGGHRWLTHSPRFAITQIAIRGTLHVDPAALRAQLPIHEGDSVFVGLGDAARTVRANPWIASAEVHRVLPHTIVIEIREHVAAAVAVLGDLYLVDGAGRPFKRAAIEAGDGDGLPLITGIERTAFTADPDAAAATLQSAIAAANRWGAVDRRSRVAGGGDPDGSAGAAGALPRGIDRPAIGRVHVDPHGAVTLHTYHPAIAIQLGALGPELADRISAFDTAWAGLSDAERARARAIHMDARPDHVTVAFAKD